MSYAYEVLNGGDTVRLYPHIISSSKPVEPEVPFDVIVGLIQSNIRGVAPFLASDQYNDPSIFAWNWLGKQMVLAAEPLPTQENTTGMGAMNTFIKAYRELPIIPNRRLLIVNTARGGTGFTLPSTNTSGGAGLHWRHDLPQDANNLAYAAVNELKFIMSRLPAGSRIVAYLANHGSTDGSNNTPKATFKGYLTSWINWLRTEMQTPNVPYIMMQMRPDLVANEGRHRIIDEAQTEVASELPKVGKTTSPNGTQFFASDSVHFSALGFREIGTRLFAKYQDVLSA